MVLVGRRRELTELNVLLERVSAGSGGLVVFVGPAGSGRTALTEVALELARRGGIEVLQAVRTAGRPRGWAHVLRAVRAPENLVHSRLGDSSSADLDALAAQLCDGPPRLIIVDDVTRDEPETMELLTLIAMRSADAPTAVVATSVDSLGLARELWLHPLGPDEIGATIGEDRPDVRHAIWAASRGRPGPAKALATTLAESDSPGIDPVVQLALQAESGEGFLDLDPGLIRLLETALGRSTDDSIRARLLARLARELLGDASAADRRRALVWDALALARAGGDPATLAEVLDAELHALWDPAGAADRLVAAGEIVDLARASAELDRERSGLFWRFVSLMQLGRVDEAESALATFEREAMAAGDGAGCVMAVARHAMLATMRGRFADAQSLIGQVAERGRQVGLADTERLVGTLLGTMAGVRGDRSVGEIALSELTAFDRGHPGHFYGATVARILAWLGRTDEADLELQRALPQVLAGSGPRWLGAAADLATAAAATRNKAAAEQLYPALAPYRGQLVIWAGANTCSGPVTLHLGSLGLVLGRIDDAVRDLEAAAALAERIGALPWLAHVLLELADAVVRQRADDYAARASAHRRQARDLAERLDLPGVLASLSVPDDEWTLHRDGSDWLLTAGDERARLRDSRGLRYLRALLAVPGREVSALDLAAGGSGVQPRAGQPLLDAAAQDAYRRRLLELDAALDAADRAGDSARAARADTERRALLDELRRAHGIGGRPRTMGTEDERARVNVTRTLRDALDKIVLAAPHAGAHLVASIRTGRACRYEPAPGGPSRWHV